MISKSERLLIFRFLFSKKSDGYVSIFAWFSIIGISLGVAAIIIVMSVMNGFRIDLTNRIIGLNSHLNIYSFDNEITNNQADELILNIDNSFFYQHYKSIETNGLIIKSNNSKGVMIKGYDEYDKSHYLFSSINMGALIQNPKSEILTCKKIVENAIYILQTKLNCFLKNLEQISTKKGKIFGNTNITSKVTVEGIKVSKGAKESIENAGGKVVEDKIIEKPQKEEPKKKDASKQ